MGIFRNIKSNLQGIESKIADITSAIVEKGVQSQGKLGSFDEEIRSINCNTEDCYTDFISNKILGIRFGEVTDEYVVVSMGITGEQEDPHNLSYEKLFNTEFDNTYKFHNKNINDANNVIDFETNQGVLSFKVQRVNFDNITDGKKYYKGKFKIKPFITKDNNIVLFYSIYDKNNSNYYITLNENNSNSTGISSNNLTTEDIIFSFYLVVDNQGNLKVKYLTASKEDTEESTLNQLNSNDYNLNEPNTQVSTLGRYVTSYHYSNDYNGDVKVFVNDTEEIKSNTLRYTDKIKKVKQVGKFPEREEITEFTTKPIKEVTKLSKINKMIFTPVGSIADNFDFTVLKTDSFIRVSSNSDLDNLIKINELLSKAKTDTGNIIVDGALNNTTTIYESNVDKNYVLYRNLSSESDNENSIYNTNYYYHAIKSRNFLIDNNYNDYLNIDTFRGYHGLSEAYVKNSTRENPIIYYATYFIGEDMSYLKNINTDTLEIEGADNEGYKTKTNVLKMKIWGENDTYDYESEMITMHQALQEFKQLNETFVPSILTQDKNKVEEYDIVNKLGFNDNYYYLPLDRNNTNNYLTLSEDLRYIQPSRTFSNSPNIPSLPKTSFSENMIRQFENISILDKVYLRVKDRLYIIPLNEIKTNNGSYNVNIPSRSWSDGLPQGTKDIFEGTDKDLYFLFKDEQFVWNIDNVDKTLFNTVDGYTVSPSNLFNDNKHFIIDGIKFYFDSELKYLLPNDYNVRYSINEGDIVELNDLTEELLNTKMRDGKAYLKVDNTYYKIEKNDSSPTVLPIHFITSSVSQVEEGFIDPYLNDSSKNLYFLEVDKNYSNKILGLNKDDVNGFNYVGSYPNKDKLNNNGAHLLFKGYKDFKVYYDKTGKYLVDSPELSAGSAHLNIQLVRTVEVVDSNVYPDGVNPIQKLISNGELSLKIYQYKLRFEVPNFALNTPFNKVSSTNETIHYTDFENYGENNQKSLIILVPEGFVFTGHYDNEGNPKQPTTTTTSTTTTNVNSEVTEEEKSTLYGHKYSRPLSVITKEQFNINKVNNNETLFVRGADGSSRYEDGLLENTNITTIIDPYWIYGITSNSIRNSKLHTFIANADGTYGDNYIENGGTDYVDTAISEIRNSGLNLDTFNLYYNSQGQWKKYNFSSSQWENVESPVFDRS